MALFIILVTEAEAEANRLALLSLEKGSLNSKVVIYTTTLMVVKDVLYGTPKESYTNIFKIPLPAK